MLIYKESKQNFFLSRQYEGKKNWEKCGKNHKKKLRSQKKGKIIPRNKTIEGLYTVKDEKKKMKPNVL